MLFIIPQITDRIEIKSKNKNKNKNKKNKINKPITF